MAKSNHKMTEIAETIGPRDQVLLAALGKDYKKQFTVLHSQVLVAGYIPSSRTKGGIIKIDKTIEEDRWQGNIGLVIGLGKGAFKDDGVAHFHGDKLKIGEWVMFLPADGLALYINQVPCRLFQDTRILMKVINPEIYY
jgi:co-chaperonin GroES (HSP10)